MTIHDLIVKYNLLDSPALLRQAAKQLQAEENISYPAARERIKYALKKARVRMERGAPPFEPLPRGGDHGGGRPRVYCRCKPRPEVSPCPECGLIAREDAT